MYSVVGCGECTALWVVADRPDSSECPRCGTRRPFEQRRQFVETDDPDHAREVRSRLLAERSTAGESDDRHGSFLGLEAEVDAMMREGEDDHDMEPTPPSDPRSVVLRIIAEFDDPTAASIVAAGEDAGLEEPQVRDMLDRLRRSGELVESDGVYRRL